MLAEPGEGSARGRDLPAPPFDHQLPLQQSVNVAAHRFDRQIKGFGNPAARDVAAILGRKLLAGQQRLACGGARMNRWTVAATMTRNTMHSSGLSFTFL